MTEMYNIDKCFENPNFIGGNQQNKIFLKRALQNEC